MSNHAAILSFRGEYEFLSNFWLGTEPVVSSLFGLHKTGEHAFQAAKAISEADFCKFYRAGTPGVAKTFGRQIQLRPDWEEVKIQVMLEVVRAKFRQGTLLSSLLESTGNRHLEEGNKHGDQIWGTVNGVGRNLLGRILMRVRAENRGEVYSDPELADKQSWVARYWKPGSSLFS